MRGYRSLAALAELTGSDDTQGQQLVSTYGLAGERLTEVYRSQQYGFTARPPKGSTGQIVSQGGERSRAVFIGGEHEDYRPKDLREGEGKLYDLSGNLIFMRCDEGILVHAEEGDAIVETKHGKVRVSAEGDIYVAPTDAARKVYLGTLDGAGAVPVFTMRGPSRRVFAVPL
jgi:phage gp45-like